MTHPDLNLNANAILALELRPSTAPAHAALNLKQATQLTELIARDLGQWISEVHQLDLTIAAAHFDPAESLRPGWPLHQRLEELRTRAPGSRSRPRLLAFGKDDNGDIPLPLQANAELLGGSLRVVPIQLSGDAATVQVVGEILEEQLLAQGMLQADTALLLQEAFGAEIEHARYLTLHDLLAMTAMQYDNQGLAPVWPLLETALLAPQAEEWLDNPPEPLVRYIDGQARVAMFDPISWRQHYQPEEEPADKLERRFEYFQMRQRQIDAVLQAHGIPVLFVHVDHGVDPRQALIN